MMETKDDVLELLLKVYKYDGGCKDCPFRIKDCKGFLSICIVEEITTLKSILQNWWDKNE